MKYEITKEQLNNLMVFLDRVDYKGLKEIAAINDIMKTLSTPIKENGEDK